MGCVKNDVWIIQNKLILLIHFKTGSLLQSILSKIKYLKRISNCLLARFNRGNRHVYNCSTVRNGVDQQIPRGLIRFCDEYFAVVCFVLLFLVQRRTLVLVRV